MLYKLFYFWKSDVNFIFYRKKYLQHHKNVVRNKENYFLINLITFITLLIMFKTIFLLPKISIYIALFTKRSCVTFSTQFISKSSSSNTIFWIIVTTHYIYHIVCFWSPKPFFNLNLIPSFTQSPIWTFLALLEIKRKCWITTKRAFNKFISTLFIHIVLYFKYFS